MRWFACAARKVTSLDTALSSFALTWVDLLGRHLVTNLKCQDLHTDPRTTVLRRKYFDRLFAFLLFAISGCKRDYFLTRGQMAFERQYTGPQPVRQNNRSVLPRELSRQSQAGLLRLRERRSRQPKQ